MKKNLDDFLKSTSRAPSSPNRKKAIELAIEDAKQRLKTKNFSDCKPRLFLGLFAVYYETLYGLYPISLWEKPEYMKAHRTVKNFREKNFRTDLECVRYIRWFWKRQKRIEDIRLANGEEPHHVTVWRVFSVVTFEKYLVSKEGRRDQKGYRGEI